MVDFVGLSFAEHSPQGGGIIEIRIMQLEALVKNSWVLVKMPQTRSFQAAGAAYYPVNFIAFAQQPFGEVRPILPGDPRNERARHAQLVTLTLPLRWSCNSLMSASTIKRASSANRVFGSQPSLRLALL